MGTSIIGLKLGSLVSVDNGLTVPPGEVWVPGNSFDLGPDTDPQAFRLASQFSIANAGSTDGYDLQVWCQWSDNGTDWPSDKQGILVAPMSDVTAAASLPKSRVWQLPVPLLRHGRLCYISFNGTDALTVDSSIAQHLRQIK